MEDTGTAEAGRWLSPARYIDSDDPEIVAFARDVVAGAADDTTRAVRLYYAVRDRIRYDPYCMGKDDNFFRASDCLRAGRGFCIPKAALLAAAGRAVGLPSRLAYADVRNHLSTPGLLALLGTDLFIWHGCTEFLLPGPSGGERRWVKCTPAFNLTLCERFGVHPLEFDGSADSLFHENTRDGSRHMEYVNDRGAFDDVPVEAIVRDFDALYPRLFEALGAGRSGDFEREAGAAGEA